jgi:LmbE family N-acetylglucosaminyl deacetylase
MLTLPIGAWEPCLDRILFLGAHGDDIEIGCGGTALKLIERARPKAVTWVVFSADDAREGEARASASAILSQVGDRNVIIKRFRDGFFPSQIGEIKECFEAIKATEPPSLIFTHYRGDLHQDHRVIADLTWQTFRDHPILEYEVPKFDGDLGAPNVFVQLDEPLCRLKIDNLLKSFASQRHRRWFTPDVFMAILRLRGLESNAPSGYAEAFYGRKVVLG